MRTRFIELSGFRGFVTDVYLNEQRIAAARGSYSRTRQSTLRPVRTGAAVCSLNSAGYGFFVLGMKNTFILQVKSVHQPEGIS